MARSHVLGSKSHMYSCIVLGDYQSYTCILLAASELPAVQAVAGCGPLHCQHSYIYQQPTYVQPFVLKLQHSAFRGSEFFKPKLIPVSPELIIY